MKSQRQAPFPLRSPVVRLRQASRSDGGTTLVGGLILSSLIFDLFDVFDAVPLGVGAFCFVPTAALCHPMPRGGAKEPMSDCPCPLWGGQLGVIIPPLSSFPMAAERRRRCRCTPPSVCALMRYNNEPITAPAWPKVHSATDR